MLKQKLVLYPEIIHLSKLTKTVRFMHELLFKIQLLWHVYTHKGMNDRTRFETMLSMTKSWASFGENHHVHEDTLHQSDLLKPHHHV